LGADAAAVDETRATTAWVLAELVHLLHPIMPFITEALWRHLAGPEAGLLIVSRWPHYAAAGDADAAAEMEWIVALVSSIRTARAEMNVPGGAEVPARIVTSDPDRARIGRDHAALIRRLARLASIEVGAEPPRDKSTGALQVVVDGATAWLDLAGIIDIDAERKRLGREAATLKGELDKIAQKLANPQFVSKAKPDVIEEQREREADAHAKLARIDAAIARIGAG
jgi:valyl-tRNA synthetase